jgi:hypothetical protein
VTTRDNLRHVAHRALGTPDASEVATRLDTIEATLARLQQAVDELSAQSGTNHTELSACLDDTRRQLDQLRDVALEHTEALDRLRSGDTDAATN